MILSQGDLGITTLKSKDHFIFEFKGFYNGIFICTHQINKILKHIEYQRFTERLFCAGTGKY